MEGTGRLVDLESSSDVPHARSFYFAAPLHGNEIAYSTSIYDAELQSTAAAAGQSRQKN